jgi:hypothetical protein
MESARAVSIVGGQLRRDFYFPPYGFGGTAAAGDAGAGETNPGVSGRSVDDGDTEGDAVFPPCVRCRCVFLRLVATGVAGGLAEAAELALALVDGIEVSDALVLTAGAGAGAGAAAPLPRALLKLGLEPPSAST